MALPQPEPEVIELTGDDAWAYFDAEARRLMQMSGAEFLEAWDAGVFGDTEGPDHSKLILLSMLLEVVRDCAPAPAQ